MSDVNLSKLSGLHTHEKEMRFSSINGNVYFLLFVYLLLVVIIFKCTLSYEHTWAVSDRFKEPSRKSHLSRHLGTVSVSSLKLRIMIL